MGTTTRDASAPLDTRPDGPCLTCAEGYEATGDERCPMAKRACNHHCNCLWTADVCDWCGAEPDGHGGLLPGVRVKPSPSWGWKWNVGHTCSYVCGAGGCDGAGWRPTRRWAVLAGRRYQRLLARWRARTNLPWQTTT